MNASLHAYEWDMPPTWIGPVTRINESCQYECIIAHIRMRHATHRNRSCHTYEYVGSIWMQHVTHMNASCHTYEWDMSPTWMGPVTHIKESCHANEWATNHSVINNRGDEGAGHDFRHGPLFQLWRLAETRHSATNHNHESQQRVTNHIVLNHTHCNILRKRATLPRTTVINHRDESRTTYTMWSLAENTNLSRTKVTNHSNKPRNTVSATKHSVSHETQWDFLRKRATLQWTAATNHCNESRTAHTLWCLVETFHEPKSVQSQSTLQWVLNPIYICYI